MAAHAGGSAVRQGLLIGGRWVDGASWFEVSDRFSGELVAEVAAATEGQVANAVAAAQASFLGDRLTPYERYEILLAAAGKVASARELFERSIVTETGFTFADARGEVDRCIQTLTVTAEEAKRIAGEVVPIDGAPRQQRRLAYTIRVPRGVVCAITPFNSPLNTVAHKVAPALAGGNTVVLKPSSYTPLTAALLCRALADAGLPPGYLNLVSGSGRTVGGWLAGQEGVRYFTFTGSTEVGRALRQEAGLRPTSLELGSIASTMICEDADLDDAVGKCVSAAFRKAGQVCTSIQRLYVHADVFTAFMDRMLEATVRLEVGDPWQPATDVGPMIDVHEAERVEEWVREARAGGARVLCGGKRHGAVVEPTILIGATPAMRIVCREAFGPLVTVFSYRDLDQAVASMNDTPYGLAAGVFTRDLGRAVELTRRLHMGSVHINQTSSSRVDLMPYGGAKDSGPGREGPRYAIQDMTEERLVTMSW